MKNKPTWVYLEGEEYHSMIIECSLIDRKASNAQKYAFKILQKKKNPNQGTPQTK